MTKPTSNPTPAKKDVYTAITERIIADLEKGVRPWVKPWSGENAASRIVRPLRHNGLPYNGINILILWSEATDRGYGSPTWMTYEQAQELGGHVRKGEHGTLIVYANKYTKKETTETGEEQEREIPFLKGYKVFNVEQIENLPAQYYTKPQPITVPLTQRIEHAARFFENTGAIVRHGGDRAFYSPHLDRIQMPYPETFRDAESYEATLGHEVIHWTKHLTRLNRDLGRKKWGDEGYAMEELVAELGSAFLCADLSITPEVREDHSAYIASWLKVLKDDKRAIFAATRLAAEATEYLHGLQKSPIEAVPEAPTLPALAAPEEAAPVAESSPSSSHVERLQASRRRAPRRQADNQTLTLDLDFGRG